MDEQEKEKMIEYLERLKKARRELVKLQIEFNNPQDKVRLGGKVEGVVLAISYFEEAFPSLSNT